MKKWLARLGVFFGLILALILSVPFFIQVDHYRPQIEKAVNEKIRGELMLGKLSLSLWGHLRIDVSGLKLLDTSQHAIMSVSHAYFQLPFSSVFSGSPSLTFKMEDPEIHLFRDQQGQLNAMSLLPSEESGTKSSSPSTSKVDVKTSGQSSGASAGAAQSGSTLPALVLKSRLGIELSNALLIYDDRKMDLKTEIKGFNLKIEDLSLGHPMQLEAWTELNTRLETKLALQGPIRLQGVARPVFQGQNFESVSLDANVIADDLEVQVPGTFLKKKGVPAKAQVVLKATPSEVQITQFKTVFLNAELNAKGELQGLESAAGPRLNLSVSTNEIQFKPWADLVPALAQYELGGAAQMTAHLQGTTSQPSYDANLVVKDLSAQAPMLKAQPRWNAQVHVKTDQVDSIRLTMAAPGTQAELKGSIVSFKKPNLNFQLTSDQMDLDQLINFESGGSAKASSAAGDEASARGQAASGLKDAKDKKAAEADYDSQMAGLRKSLALPEFGVQLGVKIGKLKANQIQISQIGCQLNFKNWNAAMDQCGLKIFQGEIQTHLALNLNASQPTYQGYLDVKGLDFVQAGEHSSPMFKNTLRGKGHFRLDLQGASFNAEAAKSNLKAKGNFKVQPAEFSSLDIMKMLKESVDQALLRVTDKVPLLKGKGIGALPNIQAEYDEISSDFTIQNATFSAPNFLARAKSGKGVDLKGRTEVGMKTYTLDAFWELTDPYNLTHLRDISVEQSGVKVESIFADGGAPVHFPLHVGCTLTAPCYSSTEIPEALGKVALNNISKALSSKAKSELMKRASGLLNQLPGGVPAGITDRWNGLFH